MKKDCLNNPVQELTRDELIELVLSLQSENKKLREALETLQRIGKRQVSPFSKGQPKKQPKKPGRKSGEEHGEHHRREEPKLIDREIHVPIETGLMDPDGHPLCPDCYEPLNDYALYAQYQTDIPPPPQPIVTKFNIEVARCPYCERRFQGRHEEQTSPALHAAKNQLGPRLLGLAAELKYGFGLSYEKVQKYFSRHHDLNVSRSTICRASQRLAQKALPSYEQLILSIRRSRVVCADETGWRINGNSAWLWVFSAQSVTVYLIDPHRGHAVAERVLGKYFKGKLSTDGFLAYDALAIAPQDRQQCQAHLLKRSRELQALKTRQAVVFSRQVAAILKAGIKLHQRHTELTEQGFKIQRGKIEAAMDRVLDKQLSDPDNARFARHLRKHRESLFTYLYDEQHELAPTNNEAEREIRPGVITRKLGACNRSHKGAATTSVLTSLIRSCTKRTVDFVHVAVDLLRSPQHGLHPALKR